MAAARIMIGLMFTEPLLGTVAFNPELYSDFIAAKAPEPVDDELESLPSVEEQVEKSTTGFHREDGQPCLYDYVVKGFLKDAASCLRRVNGTASKKHRAYKKLIDGLVFVEPRRIPLMLPEGAELTILERPLRAQTAKGERVALARSECAPVGTSMRFTLNVLDPSLTDWLHELLEYGALRGLGQWRNAGYGRFDYRVIDESA